MVEVLYEGLLWGADPRPLIYDLRRRLYSQFPNRHDWASLTAYVALPHDFDEQRSSIQINQAMGSINAAMNHADEVTRQSYGRIKSKKSSSQTTQTTSDLLDSARTKMDRAKKKLEDLCKRIPSKEALIYGYL